MQRIKSYPICKKAFACVLVRLKAVVDSLALFASYPHEQIARNSCKDVCVIEDEFCLRKP